MTSDQNTKFRARAGAAPLKLAPASVPVFRGAIAAVAATVAIVRRVFVLFHRILASP
jgi:hypothetical protein